jgi:hypothetical protein
MTSQKSLSPPLVEWNTDHPDFNGFSVLIMGMTAMQIRGLRDFYTRLTGNDDLPETIGDIREQANALRALLNRNQR